MKTGRIFEKKHSRNTLCQAKAGQAHQHTDCRRIQAENEKYRMRNTPRSAGVKRNFWLHALRACTQWYSTYQIRWENWWL